MEAYQVLHESELDCKYWVKLRDVTKIACVRYAFLSGALSTTIALLHLTPLVHSSTLHPFGRLAGQAHCVCMSFVGVCAAWPPCAIVQYTG